MRTRVLDDLRTLDPARHGPVIEPTRDDQQLRAVLAEPRTGPVGSPPAPRRSTAPRAVGAAAASVAAAAVGIAVLAPWSTPQAFASWTPVPDQLSAAEVTQRVDQCPDAHPSLGGGPLEPVLLDVRGDYSFAILADDRVFVQCYLETTSDGTVFASTAEAGPVTEQPAASGITASSNGVTAWTEDATTNGAGAIALAYGRAAADVEEVELTLADGRVVDATVDGGWWAVWVPGNEPLPDEATVVTDTGRSTVVPIR